MQKEKCDPEKTNLLKEKHVERKRKHYSGSRTKTHKITESSSSDMKHEQYNHDQDARITEFGSRTRSMPFPNEKRESWWFWGDTATGQKTMADDTCSCVSCALKKLVSSDHACVMCLVILFVISVGVGCMLVYNSVPCVALTNTTPMPTQQPSVTFDLDIDRLKRKANRRWNFDLKKPWLNMMRKSTDSTYGGLDLQDVVPKISGQSSIVEPQGDLSRIFDVEKINGIQSSDRLKSFYKKLVETDNAIRNLKKTYDDNTLSESSRNNYLPNDIDFNNNMDFNNDNLNTKFDLPSNIDLAYPDRIKRSIKLFHRPGIFHQTSLFHKPTFFHVKRRHHSTTTKSKIDKGKVVSTTLVNMTTKTTKKPRSKRSDQLNDTEGFVIEKNTVVIQYKKPDGNRIVPKCSHAPKESSKSHETQLKHPFYKNTQRLDELLDQFLDRKLPDILSDQFEDVILDKKKCKHPVNGEVVIVKDEDSIISNADKEFPIDKITLDKTFIKEDKSDQTVENESMKDDKEEQSKNKEGQETKKIPKMDAFDNDFLEDSEPLALKGESTTSSFDVLLSISTLMNLSNDEKRTSPATVEERSPGLRKLMQVDANEEENVDEDLNEMIGTVPERDEELSGTETSLKSSSCGVKLRKLMQSDDEKEDSVDEELKEVVVNDNESGEFNQRIDRKKRGDLHTVTMEPMVKQNSMNIHNPNWKGAMPLYPEELQFSLTEKQTKTEAFPVQNPDNSPETDESEMGLADVEYVENYLFNGYENLVKLAQAYSDYGVLDGKKEAERKSDKINHDLQTRRATVPSGFNRFKHGFKKTGLLGRIRKGSKSSSEGIRIEMHSTASSREESNPYYLKRIVQNHVKFSPSKTMQSNENHSSTSLITPQLKDIDKFRSSKILIAENPGTIFPLTKIRRTPKSVRLHNQMEAYYNTMDSTKHPMPKYEAIKFKRDIIYFGSKDKDDSKKTSKTANDDRDKSTSKTYGIEGKRSNKNNDNLYFNAEKNVDVITKRDPTNNMEKQKSNITMGDFFMLLSKWFSALDGAHITVNQSDVAGSKVLSTEAVNLDIKNVKSLTENTEVPLLLVSNAIENVPYRSRSLLSIEENNNTAKAELTELKFEEEEEESIADISPSAVSVANMNYSNIVSTTTAISKAFDESKEKKRKVKRQADESNLVFWNDLYDDEYGLKNDLQPNNIRDKHSANKNDKLAAEKNDIIQKSNLWLHDKFNMLSNTLNKVGHFRRGAERMSRAARNARSENEDAAETDEPARDAKVDFIALTAKMKEVCKKTVQELQQAKNLRVREDDKGEIESGSLMQQLVRLMTDLVEFQVHERTCRKLPADLRIFLEWLTSPHKEREAETNENKERDMNAVEFEKPTEDVMQPDPEPADSRTDCLGTLHAVQDLIKQYDDMTDDDKSLMTGVKDYLENQAAYLQRYLTTNDDYRFYREEPRIKRDAIAKTGHSIANAIDYTASTLQHEYNSLKNKGQNIYKKIACKVKHTSHKAKKITDKFTATSEKAMGKAVATAKNISNKVCKTKYKFYNGKDENNAKIRSKTVKDNVHLKNKERNLHKEPKTGHVNNKNKSKLHHKIHEKEHAPKAKESRNNQRNIQDVYFKALEEAKKASLKDRKSTETYDKAEIFNV